MKLLLCICFATIVLAVQAVTDAQKAKMQQIVDTCKAQTGISQETIDKTRSGQVVDDPKLKVQLLCMSKRIGFMSESGDVNVDPLKVKLKKVSANDEEVDKIIQKCTVKKDTAEDTALHLFRCLKENKPTFVPVD